LSRPDAIWNYKNTDYF